MPVVTQLVTNRIRPEGQQGSDGGDTGVGRENVGAIHNRGRKHTKGWGLQVGAEDWQ